MRFPQRPPVSLAVVFAPVFLLAALLTTSVMPVKAAWFATDSAQLTVKPGGLWFRQVKVAETKTLLVTVTNTGSVKVTVSSMQIDGQGFTVSGLQPPLNLAVGQSLQFSVNFNPQTQGHVDGNIALISQVSKLTVNLPVHGSGTASESLTTNPPNLSFGDVQVNGDQTLPETITNSGTSDLTISQANISGTGFTMSGLTPPLTLTSGQSVTFNVTFNPKAGGNANGQIAVVSEVPKVMIPLAGTGTSAGRLKVSPASLNFGTVTVNTKKSLSGTLTATVADVMVSSGTLTGPEFAASGLSFPFIVTAGHSRPFTVTFAPQSSGAASATATFVSDAANSPVLENLTGRGGAAPQHRVDLAWDASESEVLGYNVYRGGKSGGPYTRINVDPDPTTTYTDTSVVAGQIYYYVSTAIDKDGVESSFSNQVKATIPTP